jgi:hypothetical protein
MGQTSDALSAFANVATPAAVVGLAPAIEKPFKGVSTAVSDIFFNMRHDERDKLYNDARASGASVTDEQDRECLRRDATDMLNWLSSLNVFVTSDELIDDFLGRV